MFRQAPHGRCGACLLSGQSKRRSKIRLQERNGPAMKKLSSFIAILIVLILSFFTGYWYRAEESAKNNPPGRQQPQPFPAADLSPDTAPEDDDASSVPGAVQVSPEKQQIMGVRVAAVKKASESHVLRILGRVAADETRTYRINAAVDGWIREIHNNTTGSLVKKERDPRLFLQPRIPQRPAGLYLCPRVHGPLPRQRQGDPPAIGIDGTQTSSSTRILSGTSGCRTSRSRRSAGPASTRKTSRSAPLPRALSPFGMSPKGLRFDKGTELYRIVDLGPGLDPGGHLRKRGSLLSSPGRA